MYESFFGFSERPFAVLPDSSRIFWTDGHRNALSVLEVGLDRLSQVTVLTGGVGTGKTTLIRHLLDTTSGAFTIGLLSNFAGERDDLLRWVLSAFGLNVTGSSEVLMYRRLETFFSRELRQGRRSVLIVDEAQNLSERDLESLRLLGNLNVDEVLLMLVLVGQPQLRAKMTRIENRCLCQRIGADYHLEPLSQEETALFVRHRCVRAGGSAALFEADALDEVHRISGGVPRKINVLCDLALVSAFAEGARQVGYATVRSVLEDARRHGTYMSLTEHDFVAVAEAGLAVGAENQPLPTMAVRAAQRDPVQRLTLVMEGGGDRPRRARSAERRGGVHDGPAMPGPAGNATPRPAAKATPAQKAAPATKATPGPAPKATPAPKAAPATKATPGPALKATPTPTAAPLPRAMAAPPVSRDAAELNALFGMHWPDDTLLFVTDPAEGGTASGPSAERPVAPPSSDTAPAERKRSEAARQAADDAAPAGRSRADSDDRPKPPAPASGGVPAFRHQPVPPRASPGAAAFPASSAELALRAAFRPQGGWRWVGRRGVALLALAAGGSVAAGIAVALLPEGAAERGPGPAAPAPAAEARLRASERVGQPGGPYMTELLEGAGAAGPAHAVIADGATLGPRAPGEAGVTAGPSPISDAMPEPPSLAEQRTPPSPVVATRHALSPEAPRMGEKTAALAVIAKSARPEAAATHARSVRAAAGVRTLAPQAAIAPERQPIPPEPPRPLAPPDGVAGAAASSLSRPDAAIARASTAAPVTEAPHPADAAPAAPLLQFAADSQRLPAINPSPVASTVPAVAFEASQQVTSPRNRPFLPADPEAMFRDALDLAVDDPRAAVVGYARAALMGHARAAYYLGQIYETGDGVPVDYAIARHWYEAASGGNPRAEARLTELPRPEQGGGIGAPMPLLAQWLGAGQADFVWTSGEGADPASYVVEVSADPRVGAAAVYPVTGSAARLTPLGGATHWRVLAVDAAGSGGAASDWRAIAPAGPDRSADAGRPAGHL